MIKGGIMSQYRFIEEISRIVRTHHRGRADCNGKYLKDHTFNAGGSVFCMKADGTLIRDGVPIMFVLPSGRFVVLRTWVAGDDLPVLSDLPLEITVESVDVTDKDMHWKNIKKFRREIAEILNAKSMSLSARFQLVIRRRVMVSYYTESFKLPDLTVSDLEKSLLAREVLCQTGENLDTDWVLRQYRQLYKLDEDQSLEDVGLTHLDRYSISTAQA